MYGIHAGAALISFEKAKKKHEIKIECTLINYGDAVRNINCPYLRMKIQREIGKETPYKVEKLFFREKISQTVWS